MPPTLRHRAANAITAVHTASTMFAMHVMLGRLAAQLKMPRPDAYMDIAYERIDIALRWTTFPSPELTTVAVANIEWVIAAAPGYLAAAGIPLAPAELGGHSCICYWRESSDDAWLLASGAHREQIRVRSR